MSAMRLDLADIQGNILRGYRTPVARYVFLRFDELSAAAQIVNAVTDDITTAVEWDGGMPESTMNIAFTVAGLKALGIPSDTLELFPSDFRQGMRARARKLGDLSESDPDNWEPLWQTDAVHCS